MNYKNRFIKKGDKLKGSFKRFGILLLYEFMSVYFNSTFMKEPLPKDRNSLYARRLFYFLCTHYLMRDKYKRIRCCDVDYFFLVVRCATTHNWVNKLEKRFESDDNFKKECELIIYKAFYDRGDSEVI